MKKALVNNFSSNYEPDGSRNIDVIIKFMRPEIYLRGSSIKNNMRSRIGWAPSQRCRSFPSGEIYCLPSLILQSLRKDITNEKIKYFNNSAYKYFNQFIKISSYDKIDVELFQKYLFLTSKN